MPVQFLLQLWLKYYGLPKQALHLITSNIENIRPLCACVLTGKICVLYYSAEVSCRCQQSYSDCCVGTALLSGSMMLDCCSIATAEDTLFSGLSVAVLTIYTV